MLLFCYHLLELLPTVQSWKSELDANVSTSKAGETFQKKRKEFYSSDARMMMVKMALAVAVKASENMTEDFSLKALVGPRDVVCYN